MTLGAQEQRAGVMARVKARSYSAVNISLSQSCIPSWPGLQGCMGSRVSYKLFT